MISILNLYFPNHALDFVAAPEVPPTAGGSDRVDLLIRHYTYAGNNTHVIDDVPVLLFEGKRATGDNFDEVRSQLVRYLDSPGKQYDTCWAIGARGTQVKFYRYVHNRRDPKMRPWKVSNRGVPEEVDIDSRDSYVFEVTQWNDADHTKSFVPIIEYMKAHPKAPAT